MQASLLCRATLTKAFSIAAFVAPALAMAQSMPMASMHSPASAAASSSKQSSMNMGKSMQGMQEKMSPMPMSGNQDYDFAMMMRMHHQGALDMAKVELEKGKDPEMRKAANKIIASQKKEIAEFDHWLAQHKQMGAGANAMEK